MGVRGQGRGQGAGYNELKDVRRRGGIIVGLSSSEVGKDVRGVGEVCEACGQ